MCINYKETNNNAIKLITLKILNFGIKYTGMYSCT